jgi:hypothetical protein
VTRSILRSIVLDELRALAGELRHWLGPCTRLTWALYWARRNVRLGRARRARFWRWRADILADKCRRMQGPGCTAYDVAIRALAIAERLPT